MFRVHAGYAAGTIAIPGDAKVGDLVPTPTGLPAVAHLKANASHLIEYVSLRLIVLFAGHNAQGSLLSPALAECLLPGLANLQIVT